MRCFVFLGVLLFCNPVWALCVSQITQDETEICLNLGGGFGCVAYDDLRNGSPQLKAVDLQERLQAIIDVRQPLIGLPVDDPDRTIDPDFPGFFWADLEGKKTAILPLTETFLNASCALVIIEPNAAAPGGFQITVSDP